MGAEMIMAELIFEAPEEGKRTTGSGPLTLDEAVAAVDMYLTGKYGQNVVADLCGISHALIWKILNFKPPYDLLPDVLGPEKLARLQAVRTQRRSATWRDVESARYIKRMAENGHHQPIEIAAANGVSTTTVWRIKTGESWQWLD